MIVSTILAVAGPQLRRAKWPIVQVLLALCQAAEQVQRVRLLDQIARPLGETCLDDGQARRPRTRHGRIGSEFAAALSILATVCLGFGFTHGAAKSLLITLPFSDCLNLLYFFFSFCFCFLMNMILYRKKTLTNSSNTLLYFNNSNDNF